MLREERAPRTCGEEAGLDLAALLDVIEAEIK